LDLSSKMGARKYVGYLQHLGQKANCQMEIVHTVHKTKNFRSISCVRDDKMVEGIALYAPMIYTAPCVMFLMRADTLRGQVGGGWAL